MAGAVSVVGLEPEAALGSRLTAGAVVRWSLLAGTGDGTRHYPLGLAHIRIPIPIIQINPLRSRDPYPRGWWMGVIDSAPPRGRFGFRRNFS